MSKHSEHHSHSHEHTHDHSHEHGHGHHHHGVESMSDITRAFFIGIILNLGFVIAEVIYGTLSNSIALLADAGHNLQDVLGLALSAFSIWLAGRPSTKRHTYGYRKSTILASLANSLFLVFACGAILWESFHRFNTAHVVDGRTMGTVAIVGIVINLGSALLFLGHRHELNSRGAFIHLATDAVISLAVAISGYLIYKTGYSWIDPAVSIGVAAMILYGTWNLLKNALGLALDIVPEGISVDEVKAHLLENKSLLDVHHIHIWPLSTFENAMTAHIRVEGKNNTPDLLREISHEVQHHFRIHHITLQIETGDCESDCT